MRPEKGTPPPRRSRRSRSQFVVFLNFVLSAVVLLVIAGGVAAWYGKMVFDGEGPSSTAETVLVKPNSSVAEIASLLDRRGLIDDAPVFRLGLRAYGNDGKLKAGEYQVKARASMHDIMDIMVEGKSVLYSVTVPEGLTVAQAFDRIANIEELAGDMPEKLPPEGAIAADTIRFTRGMERKEIVDKLLAQQKALVDNIWERREDGLPIDSIDDFVTLASIVEKETGRADERPRVAAVFINRLKKGMRLQSDPTIIYGLFGGEGKPADRPIYKSDLEKPTPYNTYTIDGLPPTPIANPGRAALEAVANPSQTDDLYFVADGTGGHVFSSNLEEHNANVARWRKLNKEKQADSEDTPAAETGEAGADEKTGG